MSLNNVETYTREDGKHAWRIRTGNEQGTGERNIVATDGGQGYENESDALAAFFGIFFGTWDDSFLELYAKWQHAGGEQTNLPPEAEAGPNMMTQSQLSGVASDEELDRLRKEGLLAEADDVTRGGTLGGEQ